MKRKIFTILIPMLIFISTGLMAQKQKVAGRFIVTNGTVNGQDISAALKSKKIMTVFYQNNPEELSMAQVMSGKMNKKYGKEEQTYGRLYPIYHKYTPAKGYIPKKQVFFFYWKFHEIGRNGSGDQMSAIVKFTKIFSPQGIVFEEKIINGKSRKLVNFSGFMQGTIDFSNY